MPGGRATAITVGMRLGIIQGLVTDTIGIRAALNPGTGHITIAAPMLCPGTVGTHLHITVMGPVLGEIWPTFGRLDPEITSKARSERARSAQRRGTLSGSAKRLHRDGLAPSTPCRSPGALRFIPGSRHQACGPG